MVVLNILKQNHRTNPPYPQSPVHYFPDLSFPLFCSTMWLTAGSTAHCSYVTCSCLWQSSTSSLAKERPSSARLESTSRLNQAYHHAKSSLPSCLHCVPPLRNLVYCSFIYLFVCLFVYGYRCTLLSKAHCPVWSPSCRWM